MLVRVLKFPSVLSDGGNYKVGGWRVGVGERVVRLFRAKPVSYKYEMHLRVVIWVVPLGVVFLRNGL